MKQFDEARVTIELSNLFTDKQDVLETIEKGDTIHSRGKNGGFFIGEK